MPTARAEGAGCCLEGHLEELQRRFGAVARGLDALSARHDLLKAMVLAACGADEVARCSRASPVFRSIAERTPEQDRQPRDDARACAELLSAARACLRTPDPQHDARQELEFWRRKGEELSCRYDEQDAELERIRKDVSVVRRELMRVAASQDSQDSQDEAPACKQIQGVLTMAMCVVSRFEASVGEQVAGLRGAADECSRERDRLEAQLALERVRLAEAQAELCDAQAKAAGAVAELQQLRCQQQQLQQQLQQQQQQQLQQQQLQQEQASNGQAQAAAARAKDLEQALGEQGRLLADSNRLLDEARQENAAMEQKYSLQEKEMEKELNKLRCRVKTMISDLQVTKGKLEACQKDKVQLCYIAHKQKETISSLESTVETLQAERCKNMDDLAKSECKLQAQQDSFDKVIESKEEAIGCLQHEVGQLEQEAQQLSRAHGEVADEMRGWQATIATLCQQTGKLKASLAEQTCGTPRVRVLVSSRQLHTSDGSPRGSGTLTRDELCVCLGDDGAVASAVRMVEDIKQQLRAYLRGEASKREAASKAGRLECELRACRGELDRARQDLKDCRAKHNAAKHELHELRKNSKRLADEKKGAEEAVARMEQEMNTWNAEIASLEADVMKGLQTIRRQCDTIRDLQNTVKELQEGSQPESDDSKKLQTESTQEIEETPPTDISSKTSPEDGTDENPVAETLDNQTDCSRDPEPAEGCNFLRIVSELEVKIRRLEDTHKLEVDSLTRVHVENLVAFKQAFEREKAKQRDAHDRLLSKQQELHEDRVNCLEEKLSSLRDLVDKDLACKETQTPEGSIEALLPEKDTAERDLSSKETQTPEGSSEDLPPAKDTAERDLSSKETQTPEGSTEDLPPEKDTAEREPRSKETEDLPPAKEPGEQDPSPEEPQEVRPRQDARKDPGRTNGDKKPAVKKKLSMAPTEMLEYKPSGGNRCAVGSSNECGGLSQLEELHAQAMRFLMRGEAELGGRTAPACWQSLLDAACPASCSTPLLDAGRRDASSRSLFSCSCSDLSGGEPPDDAAALREEDCPPRR